MKLSPWLQIILLGAFCIAHSSVHSSENENHPMEFYSKNDDLVQ